MGRLNQRALLGRLQRLGMASRAELAKSLGMSQPTAGKIVDALLAGGVFEEVAVAPENGGTSQARLKVGRPARMIRLNQAKARFLCLHIGMDETSLALLAAGGGGADHWDARFATSGSADTWQRALRRVAAEIPQKNFWAVLVSLPGVVDERQGRVLYSPNIHWTENIDLPGLIRKIWRSPVILVQEECAVALGHQAGDPGGEDFFLADFGEGVGGAVVVGGRTVAHPLPISGELGHTPVIGNRRPCGCGAAGCLETLASTRGLLQSFAAEHPRAGRSWRALVESVAANGVEPWLARALDATAGVIAGALNVLGLRHVVITGTFSELPPVVLQYLAKSISSGSLWARFGEVKVEGAPRRRTAGLVAIGLDHVIAPVHDNEPGPDKSFPATAWHG